MKFYVFYRFCELYFLFQRKFIMRRSYFLFRSNSLEKRERVVALDFSLLSERRGRGNGARGFLYCSLEVLCEEVRGCRELDCCCSFFTCMLSWSDINKSLGKLFYLHYWDFKNLFLIFNITKLWFIGKSPKKEHY